MNCISRWFIVQAVFASCFLAAGPRAKATPLSSGGSVVATTPFVETGTVIDSASYSYSFSGGTDTGVLREEVVQTGGPGSTLDFLYQVSVTANEIHSFNAIDFTGFTTDVEQNPTGVTGDIMALGTILSSTVTRSFDGSTVNFNFDPVRILAGTTSYVQIVKTNATAYDSAGNVGLFDTGTFNIGSESDGSGTPNHVVPIFEPTTATPEPSSLVLFAGLTVGAGGVAAWRQWSGRRAAP
jgi:hypothetical protein